MSAESDLNYAAQKHGLSRQRVERVFGLFEQDMTVPFVARYRKEVTGNLDEVAVLGLFETWEALGALQQRRLTICRTLEASGQLSGELSARIAACYDPVVLEDIYLPFKPKRRTRAQMAREKGLGPLAEAVLSGARGGLEVLAEPFVDPEKGVDDVADALKGAADILAESFSEHGEQRQAIRKALAPRAHLEVQVRPEWEGKRSKFETWYRYREKLDRMPAHRLLAMRRGEAEGVLQLGVGYDRDLLAREVGTHRLFPERHPYRDFLRDVWMDAQSRLLMPSLENELLRAAQERADEEAIGVFAQNLENLLLAPPAGSRRVLAVDPGFRTGCKMAVLGETGHLMHHETIYPTAPRSDVGGAKAVVERVMKQFGIEAVVIGNGTASRETQAFFRTFLPESVILTLVSEAGASVYSASEVAREEFPDLDLTVRGAVSIGRRFQDPLSELVKIEPRSIGVGQYQHDVQQNRLRERLDRVVEGVVNRVGVDVNTASRHLLRYVAGIGPTLAGNIVSHRETNGSFRTRQDLLRVRLLGPKAYLQCAGFLRISQGDEPLDRTGIHPESYPLARAVCAFLKADVADLLGSPERVRGVRAEDLPAGSWGLPTLKDVLQELGQPGRDPRERFEAVAFSEGVHELTDLREGMLLNGVVSNVAQFGAFVDVGVHQDGLVHVSELADHFVRDPAQVVAVGDRVRVRVLSVDTELRRIQLSMRSEPGGGAASAGAERSGETGGRPRNARAGGRDHAHVPAAEALRSAWGSKPSGSKGRKPGSRG